MPNMSLRNIVLGTLAVQMFEGLFLQVSHIWLLWKSDLALVLLRAREPQSL